jgi:DNA-binding FadR family transcriptional regulator
MLKPVRRQSLSDAVFEQLRDRIVAGELEAGTNLPAERVLCSVLGVNRGAVREALKRLAQARLVAVQHGGASRVLDFRSSAGLELLPELLTTAGGGIDATVLRSVVEMRSALVPDIARLAAMRGGTDTARALETVVAEMRATTDDLPRRQRLAMDYWSHLVDGTGNVAYRLAYNSLRQTYDRVMDVLTGLLAPIFGDVRSYAALAAAVGAGDAPTAQRLARGMTKRVEERLFLAVDALEPAKATRRR